ncbi:molecular chaperone [Mesorhizobium sp.]|uniref:molecular chaperone n=1 Tax=Mesorhizobium sp. TaxID=1871066 RepID=UPI00257D9725|nr:molecular chaperone [Mesorhizobium sp.]
MKANAVIDRSIGAVLNGAVGGIALSTKKLPFISSVNLVQIDGRSVVPTAIYYGKDRRTHIGYEARERCESPERLLEDFKIELGQHDPDAVTKKTAGTPHTPRTTVVGITQDFFRELLGKVNDWLELHGRPLPKNLLIAEPLALAGTDMADENWLSNYRRAIRRILHGRFEQVDFLPEPFAVFQYYRYGLRHPVIAANRKHIALVLDFGGGTFDISVIETTKSGDVSGSGVNSRPLGAKSVQVGGFYINRLLASDLLMKAVAKDIRADVRKSIERANGIKTPDDLAELSEKQQTFYRHYRRLLQVVENAKISVCNSIANWSLAADLSRSTSYPISVPVNPYDSGSRTANLKLDAGLLRQTFEEGIWNGKLRDAVKKTIERASKELRGQDISVVLLSGGSSNIQWLARLIERDLGSSELAHAEVVKLSENFQEIVAKGLATECARRFYTEGQGDFRAVTYNRLCLALRPDDGHLEIRRAKPTTPKLAVGAADGLDAGVLLPSASSLRGLVGTPLLWKVRLNSPPRRLLEYYFMRSSFDPDDLEARHNIVETRAVTPKDARFGGNIEVELTVREDGTAIPRFIYGRNDMSDGVIVEGKAFHIDMTFASDEVGGSTYLGLDFGTSASACSFVDSSDVHMIQERSSSPGWRELTELLSDLPYPAAAPLARFISERDAERRNQRARGAVEALMTLAAYGAYLDLCARKPGGGLFKGFSQRSAGPLWGLIRNCVAGNETKLEFAAPLSPLVRPDNAAQIDLWIEGLNSDKHDRRQAVDWMGFLGMLANHVARMFEGKRLGVFEGVVAKRFHAGSYSGIFRVLHGSSQTFVDVLEYSGPHPFSDELVYIVDPMIGRALPLSPLYFWGLERDPTDPFAIDMHEFDSDRRGRFGFKATQPSEGLDVSTEGDFVSIYYQLAAMRGSDQIWPKIEGLTFKSYDE